MAFLKTAATASIVALIVLASFWSGRQGSTSLICSSPQIPRFPPYEQR